ncbi:MAG: T9SS type A sorting domain-containing protein, partial [Bacteroidia bacterium]
NFPGVGDGFDVNAVFGLQNCTPLARTDEFVDLGSDEIMESEFLFEIWPNPAIDRISMNILTKSSNQLELKLTDLSGRVIHQEQIPAADANMIRDFSLNAFSSGVYFISLSSNGYTEIQKIIKQ